MDFCTHLTRILATKCHKMQVNVEQDIRSNEMTTMIMTVVVDAVASVQTQLQRLPLQTHTLSVVILTNRNHEHFFPQFKQCLFRYTE